MSMQCPKCNIDMIYVQDKGVFCPVCRFCPQPMTDEKITDNEKQIEELEAHIQYTVARIKHNCPNCLHFNVCIFKGMVNDISLEVSNILKDKHEFPMQIEPTFLAEFIADAIASSCGYFKADFPIKVV